ncbi:MULTISPECIES: tetratricopeptide repeat protein [Asticcacaulis]|uniref:tetratricopeptide repeat protein n=1 Tax=Asticcacaulis TaxID=76890 RepID=UPI00285F48E3|nr:tetratricopeptide repeat protein [Asticcacaulis sp. BE141]MBP2159345.1 Tfp pilus assembly protein PilF [Asticcacaulis solisilvae]MDR6800390.1 Tfp pilus assembly protein PilF [Asticcacaulis sp. BE141]
MSTGRLDGWKSIGAHFGRDRTTVMRWARERGMPVKRIPGGKTGTVYAVREELDRWAASQSNLGDDAAGTPAVPVGFRLTSRQLWIGGAAAGLVLAGTILSLLLLDRPAPSRTALPSDPAISAAYLKARDDWAQRTPERLTAAITGFELTTRRDPNFAPGWSGLADAYLLSREFGAMADGDAFPKAKAAAEHALALDPSLPGAHRARGFILYWWEGKPAEAGRAFRRALERDPSSAQTHFWYGNILADNGQHVAAQKALNAARLIEPGSVAIQTDLAWARWSAGDEAGAQAALTELAKAHPDFPVIHDCLAVMALADGDYVGYVQSLNAYARLRQDTALMSHAARLRDALKVGATEVQHLLMVRAMAEIAAGTRRTHAWPVFLASVAQDRQQTLTLLKAADARGEVWGDAGVTARILRLWINDAEISQLVRRRKAASVI